MRVPDVQQHVVPPRSIASSIPASEGPSYQSQQSDVPSLAEHASSRHSAASHNPFVPEIGQADLGRPVPTLATSFIFQNYISEGKAEF